MQTLKLFGFLVLTYFSYALPGYSSVGLSGDIRACPYSADTSASEALASPSCIKYAKTHLIDPQNREIWLFGELEVSPQLLQSNKPLGLFIFGKASTVAYLNGDLLGENGRPGANPAAEVPGKMYATIYVPKERLLLGSNKIALHMSSHHGWWQLGTPLHRIALDTYAEPKDLNLNKYWPSLLPFGVLIIGALYMGLLAFSKRDHWSAGLLPLMSLIGAAQLYAEVYRAFSAYPYPVHDIRLSAIFVCSTLFGVCLLAHVIWSLNIAAKPRTFLIACAATLLCILLVDGFDVKSAAGLMIPALAGFGLASYQAFKKEPRARSFAIALALFIVAMLLSPWLFLDITFFYILATLLIILFINEAKAYLAEHNARRSEQARADKLQATLEQKQERDKSGSINVGSAGKLERIMLSDIVYCKGAGDYAELILTEGRSVLHSERLNDLEQTLPSVFLRVHRSYIVNTSKIISLERKPSGVGELALVNDHSVPVSRRIMPSVRSQLT